MEFKEKLKKALTELRKEKQRKFDQTLDLIINLQKFDVKKSQLNLIITLPHKIKDKKEMIDFIENYEWSSYKEILEKNNFLDIINKKLFFETYNLNKREVKEELLNLINH